MRNDNLVRVLRLAKAVDGVRTLATLAPLARAFDVSTKTVYRDLRALDDAGWPVPTYRYHPRTNKGV